MKRLSGKLSVYLATVVTAAGIAFAVPTASFAADSTALTLEQDALIHIESSTSSSAATTAQAAKQSTVATTAQTATTAAKATSSTSNNVTTETVIIKNQSSTAQVKAINRARWLKICKNMLVKLKRKHFRYSNGGGRSTYLKSVAKKRRANCAYYVSWCLQEYGATRYGQTFYSNGNGSVRKNFKFGSNIKVYRVNKRASSVKLQPGDIICWKGTPHMNVYAGTYNGKRYWYDGGKIATASNRNGSLYTHTSMQHLGYLDHRKIGCIIRILDI